MVIRIDLLERILEQKTALKVYASENPELVCIHLLKHFKEITILVQSLNQCLK